jgi:hypothetical protein
MHIHELGHSGDRTKAERSRGRSSTPHGGPMSHINLLQPNRSGSVVDVEAVWRNQQCSGTQLGRQLTEEDHTWRT